MKTKIYAAYGSNMNVDQMQRRCPGARIIGTGWAHNYKLTFRGRNKGVANIEEQLGEKVPIVLWAITQTCEKALDIYEGFPTLYTKKMVSVETETEVLRAIAYIMVDKYKKLPALPSDQYYSCIAQGYDDNGIDFETLDDAYADTLKEVCYYGRFKTGSSKSE